MNTKPLFSLLLTTLLPFVILGQNILQTQIQHSSGEVCDGSIYLVVEQGLDAPYNYQWSNGTAGQPGISRLCVGNYSLTITDAVGCQTMLSFEISNCFALNHQLTPSICGSNGGGSITLTPVAPTPSTYRFQWSDGNLAIGATHQRINLRGRHCVTVTDVNKINCKFIKCFEFDRQCPQINSNVPPVVINEISNGNAPAQEYIELLVVGYGDCTPVDIRNFIVDDNNGDFTNINTSIDLGSYEHTGIAHGYVRFSNISRWASVPIGSIILLYNPAHKNTAIQLPDDPADSNGDKVYVIPISDVGIEGTELYPTPMNPLDYRPNVATYNSNMSWKAITLFDDRDAAQVRYPNGAYCHGISYGYDTEHAKTNGGPHGLKVHNASLGYQVAFLKGGVYLSPTGYLVGSTATATAQTPGRFNTTINAGFANCLCNPNCRTSDVTAVGRTSSQQETPQIFKKQANFALRAFPNPFNDVLNVRFELADATPLQLTITDLFGKTLRTQSIEGQTGENLLALPLAQQLAAGVYLLKLSNQQGAFEVQKIVFVAE